MADEVPAGQAPAPAGQAPAGETATDNAAVASQADAAEPKTFDAEYVKRLRGEAAEARTARKQLEARLAELETAEERRRREAMSEVDRLKLELQETQTKYQASHQAAQDRALRNAVALAAAKAEFIDPDDAWRMIDVAALTVDDEGAVSGVEQALKTVVKAKPYLIRQKPAADLNASNGRGDGKVAVDEQAKLAELRQRFRF
jgi:hypothetical protein